MTEPTRISNSTSSLIDLIFVSSSVNVILCTTIPPLANADHCGLHLIISTKSCRNRSKRVIRKIWRYDQADFDQAMELLDSVEWNSILLPDDVSVDAYWSTWKRCFLQIMEICIPHAVLKLKRNVPWMNRAIADAIKQRNVLFHTAKRSGRPLDRAKYNLKRNKVTTMLRNSKQSFFDRLNSADAKSFWKSIKLLNNQQSSVPVLQFNGTTAQSSTDKADALNNYFYSCFNHSCPPLSNSVDNDYVLEDLPPNECPTDLLCTEDSIFDLLAALDTSKSTGHDDISAKMLKCTAESITPSLTELFNLSITTGVFPSEWKTGRIVPILKGNNQSLPSGFRPISILPIISKLLERHVKCITEKHLLENTPISPRQWGFMTSRSTVSALINVIDVWNSALDQGYEVCAIFFDVRKAFDTVPHLPLLQSMEKLGLNGYLLRWIRSYLLYRSQFVAVEGCNSCTLPVVSGVPQGSVLGPLLFICYINDIPLVVSPESGINLFADDIVLYRIIKTSTDYDHLQHDINSISSCISGKHLQFNTAKCRLMFITRKKIHSLPPPCLTINDTALTQVQEYKYLGVIITSDLSWTPHITNLCNRSRRLIGLLYRRFYKHASSNTLLKLYISFIRPRLEYSSAVWNPYLKGEVEALEKVQKYALKVCLKSWDVSYDDLLREASLPSLQLRRIQASLCHLFKIINDLTDFPEAPVSVRQSNYNSRSTVAKTLSVPTFRTCSYQNSFFPLAITIWNQLPNKLRNCTSLTCFKRHLSDYILL